MSNNESQNSTLKHNTTRHSAVTAQHNTSWQNTAQQQQQQQQQNKKERSKWISTTANWHSSKSVQQIDTRTRNKRENRNEKTQKTPQHKDNNTRNTTTSRIKFLRNFKIKKIDQSEETLFETDFVTYYVAFKVKTTRFRSGRCLYMLYGPVMLCRWVYVYVLLIHIVLAWLWWIWKFHDLPYDKGRFHA